MKIKLLLYVFAFIVIGFIFSFSTYLLFSSYSDRVCFDDLCFYVDIAKTQEQKQKGLMGVEELPEDSGMLFVYDESDKYSFWMKNTLIELDMIWIDENYKVVDIQHSAVPCESTPCEVYEPQKPARYILELNGGKSEKYGIEVGDKVEIFY
ncbi:DUF192 domain-containing protein [Candidatus Absconditicoccus praedator]|uniref:DUF192 domain-containing protein n=1 Tax=Candidatus Absconditicoccus praedator TaxID=2735562 RepID=UPI001E5CA93C|nr:DUF192 domain-containing protein [Candidatus Absconditicoccus praedator]UFX82675.1 DUF192 domain-containing protein [Candidatus Absconditicoccus praedator]